MGYKVSVRLPSADFQKICRDLKEFGETMQIKATKEGITFSVQGDIGGGNVMLKPRESEKPEEKVSLTVHEPVTAPCAIWSTLQRRRLCVVPWSWAWVQTRPCW